MRKSRWFEISICHFTAILGTEAETLHQAWDKTLEKWRLIIQGKECVGTVRTCGLCDMFQTTDGCLTKCPIRKETGLDYCDGTPYRLWQDSPTTQNAKVELAFLRIVKRKTYKPKTKKG